MIPRERLSAIARGGEVDQAPVVALLGCCDPNADAVTVPFSEVAATLSKTEDQAVLGYVMSPLGKAMKSGLALTQILSDDPATGQQKLSELTELTRTEMATALDQGADGVFYELEGAYPAETTPMEYGGHYLEVDRQLLEEVRDARFNVLFIQGDDAPYVDFVIDLPAQAFAWDAQAGIDIAEVRTQREGAIALSDGTGDVLLLTEATKTMEVAQ